MKRADGTGFHRTTQAQLAYIAKHWRTKSCREIAAVIDMRPGTVRQCAKRLGLRKHVTQLSAIRKVARGHAPTRGPVAVLAASPFAMLVAQRAPASSLPRGRVHRCLDDELEAA